MKKSKKFLSVFLVVLMLFSSAPLSANVGDLFAIEASAAEIVATGKAGPNATWTLDDEGTFTISGTGKMYSYYYISADWHNYRVYIINAVIEEGITDIGMFTFYNCTNLESVTVATSVTSVGDRAFENCNSSITVYYLGSEAQWSAVSISSNCNDVLTAATMDYAIIATGTCGDSLTWELDKYGTLTVSGEGAMYDYSSSSLAPWYDYCDFITCVVLEYGATSIGDYAFYNCTSLANVIIPDGVTQIAYAAFATCMGLESITIPDSVTKIDNSAFFCSTLETVYYSGSIVQWNAISVGFNNSDLLDADIRYGVPSGKCGDSAYWVLDESSKTLTISGTGAIYDYSSSDDTPWYYYQPDYVIVQEGITRIGKCALSELCELKSLSLPDSLTEFGYNAFEFTEVSELTVPQGITVIPHSAFWGCTFETITLPAALTTIESSAFIDCYALTTVYFEGTEEQWNNVSIDNSLNENSAIINAPHIIVNKEAVEPTHLTAGREAGKYCINCGEYVSGGAETAVLPSGKCGENLTWIYNYLNGTLTISGTGDMYDYDYSEDIMAEWYEQRENIKSVVIEDGATSIGNCAFYNCPNLESAVIPSSVKSIGYFAFEECYALKSLVIPDSVESIGGYAFLYCTSLSSLTLGNSLTSIGNEAFAECSALSDLTIPDGVESIGSYAFSGCNSLKSVIIPDSVTDLGEGVFTFCTALEDITLPSGITQIPEKLLSDCDALTSVTIPDSITQIDYKAFCYCDQLATVYYIGTQEQWNAVNIDNTDYGNDAIINAAKEFSVETGICGDKLTWVFNKYTGVLTISGTGDMYDYGSDYYSSAPWILNKTQLKTVIIEEGATSIGSHAFNMCSRIESITLPEGITRIGDSAFNACGGITSLTIPKSVTEIDDMAFASCLLLEEITIPDGIAYISIGLFAFCSELKTVTLPASITSIGLMAFYDCTALDTVYFGGTYSQWNAITIDDTDNGNDLLHNVAHAIMYMEYKAPTCTENGHEAGEYCIKCKENSIPKLGHQGETEFVWVEDSEQWYGWTVTATKNCSRCGETITATAEVVRDNYMRLTATVTFEDGTTQTDVKYVSDEIIVAPVNCEFSPWEDGGKLMTGLTPGIASIEDYIYVSDPTCTIANLSQTRSIGTGTWFAVINQEDYIVECFEVLIFGDVNGDGWYDAEDAFLVNLIISGILTEETLGAANYMAADCNQDGVVDETDMLILEKAGLMLASVDQALSQAQLALSSDYIEYASLIEQNIEGSLEISVENNQPEAPTIVLTESTKEFDVFALIQKLFEQLFMLLSLMFK